MSTLNDVNFYIEITVDGAMIGGVMEDGPIMSDDEYERLRKRYDEHVGGIEIELPDHWEEYEAFKQGPE